MKKRTSIGIKSIFRSPELLLMLLPGLVFLFLFRYLPMLNITIAFKDYNIFAGIQKSPWVGLKHFQTLVQSKEFFTVLFNTVIISGMKILFGFPFPIILALLLNEICCVPFKRISQNLFYLPHFLSWVVIAGLCFDVFSIAGVINSVVSLLGGQPVSFLMEPRYFRGVLVVTDIWKGAGWGSIIYLAALTSLDTTLYDAAKIDGAGRFAQLWFITLPGIVPIIIVMFIIRLSHVLDVGFDQIIMLYNSRVMSVADVLDTYVYRLGINRAQYDFSTAVGLFKSLVSLILVLSSNSLIKWQRGEGIW
jgi:putative aldouronate transport system permease protein